MKKYFFIMLIAVFSINSFSQENIDATVTVGNNTVDIDDFLDQAVAPINKDKILKLINQKRVNGFKFRGVDIKPAPPVRWNDKLAEAAQIHSDDMEENKFFSHTGSNRSELKDRLKKVGYNGHANQILFSAIVSEEGIVESLAGSVENIFYYLMNEYYTEVGIAKSKEYLYWTVIFAKPYK